jgi:methionyl-tRNA formyltransferase
VFSALVFAYSEVGFRCLRTLLDRGVNIPLVFTHADAPGEVPWFQSVARLAKEHGIEVVTRENPNSVEWVKRVGALTPHYIFSFYYRSMLGQPLLNGARWAALNMHGSLLPKYRGRAPVNWAILNGESSTGVTLHYMVSKPDAGPIVAQRVVPIGRNDTALTVSIAVAQGAADLLEDCLPLLAEGPPAARPMDLTQGSYFGGRTPEDGRIDWSWPAERLHALIRAVAPPFPGAFTDLGPQRIVFESSRWTGESARSKNGARLYVEGGEHLHLDCADGLRLEIPSVSIDGRSLDACGFARLHGDAPLLLHNVPARETIVHEETTHPRR